MKSKIIKTIFIKLGKFLIKKGFNLIFTYADKNKDGKISKQEIIYLKKKFLKLIKFKKE